MAALYKYNNGIKIGYKDRLGNIVVPAKFDDGVSSFGTEITSSKLPYGIVVINNMQGVIDEMGNIIIPTIYHKVLYLFEDLFAVRADQFFGVINIAGEVIVPFEYNDIDARKDYIKCYKDNCADYRYYEYSKLLLQRYKSDNSDYFDIYDRYGKLLYEVDMRSSCRKFSILFKTSSNLNIDDGIYAEINIVRKDRVIVRTNNEDTWSFHVLNELGETVIPPIYKHIYTPNGYFFCCVKSCECEYEYNNYSSKKIRTREYSYFNKSEEIWCNADGKVIYEGNVYESSPTHIVVEKDGKKGVYDYDGNKIINFQYDYISFINDKIVVGKDNNVGILDKDGKVIVTPSFKSIEFVNIKDIIIPSECLNPTYKFIYGDSKDNIYGAYSHSNIFDSNNKRDKLIRYEIKIAQKHYSINLSIFCSNNGFSYDNIMILRSDKYAELYSVENGIFQNSKYDDIKQLTDVTYVVKNNGKYGIYNVLEEKVIIPCEYERIIFEGGSVVLVCKDSLWGAKTLFDIIDNPFKDDPLIHSILVDVPVKFKEISILDNKQKLYGVRKNCVNCWGDEIGEFYTIIDQYGEEYEEMGMFYELSSMPVLYDENHILTSKNDKYGFISVKGYESVPFIYDEIKERNDSLFDVRIANCWGVIDMLGKTIVSIKYNAQIKGNGKFDNLLVIDSISGRKGILDSDGREKIPTVYDHLIIKDKIIYCGFGGYDDDDSNFFSGCIKHACWGVVTKEGVPIIEPSLYNCFKEKDGYILAGRDGGFLYEGQPGYSFGATEYSGVYDLYDYDGKLILGGFNNFYKDNELQLLYFHFGGEWEQEFEDYDECGNATNFYDYYFKEGNGRWLVLDENRTSIIPKSDGNVFTFSKGAKCTITRKEKDGKIIDYWSFPLELFSIEKPVSFNGFLLIGNYNSQRVIRIEDKVSSLSYTKLKVIDSEIFFTYKKEENCSGVGIASIDKELISCNEQYLLLTYPVSEYVFAVKKVDDNYKVLLINIMNPTQIITAIDKINYSDMAKLLWYDKLQLFSNEVESDVECITVRDKTVFDNSFITSIKVEESDAMECLYHQWDIKNGDKNEEKYWFSVDLIIDIDDILGSYDNNWDDDYDYRGESWDAMTDGMYGDMPDDFDGDYSFMGR